MTSQTNDLTLSKGRLRIYLLLQCGIMSKTDVRYTAKQKQ